MTGPLTCWPSAMDLDEDLNGRRRLTQMRWGREHHNLPAIHNLFLPCYHARLCCTALVAKLFGTKTCRVKLTARTPQTVAYHMNERQGTDVSAGS